MEAEEDLGKVHTLGLLRYTGWNQPRVCAAVELAIELLFCGETEATMLFSVVEKVLKCPSSTIHKVCSASSCFLSHFHSIITSPSDNHYIASGARHKCLNDLPHSNKLVALTNLLNLFLPPTTSRLSE